MGYSIIDLLDKLIVIEQNGCEMYKNIAAMGAHVPQSLRTAAMVLAREEERHEAFYSNIKEQVSPHKDIEIDFDIYDKASSLVDNFKKTMVSPKTHSVKELIRFALEIEEENVALLLAIQGRLVKTAEDTGNTSYLALADLIVEEQRHIDNLKSYMGQ